MIFKIVTIISLFLTLGALARGPVLAQTAQVELEGASGSFVKDSTVEVEVKINTEEAVTAGRIFINFDPQKLAGVSIDHGESAFTTGWPESIFDNTLGQVRLQAVQIRPGVTGEEIGRASCRERV